MLSKIKRLVASVYAIERNADALVHSVAESGDATVEAIKTQTAALSSSFGPLHPKRDVAAILASSDLLFATETREPRHILTSSTHIYSQNYEDSIIAEIFRRIGIKSKLFVEVGIGDGRECNTRLLLEQGWSGLWVEGDATFADAARERMATYIESGALQIISTMVSPDMIQDLLQKFAGERQIDFLSLDIDYNTSHLWRGISSKARVVCIEYNASVPPPSIWEVEYDGDRSWDGSNRFGASLKTMEEIGREKGMALVGCDFHGVNAFFVSENETEDYFLEPFTAEKHHTPPRYHLITHRGHPKS